MWSVKEIERVVRGQSNTVRVEIENIKAVGFDTVEIAVCASVSFFLSYFFFFFFPLLFFSLLLWAIS